MQSPSFCFYIARVEKYGITKGIRTKMREKKQRLLSFFALSVLLFSLTVSLASCEPPSTEQSEYASSYFDGYGLPEYDEKKFREAELIFSDYFVLPLPSPEEHAELTVSLYFEKFHEKIDTGDTDAVTDALLSCYVYASGDKYAVYRNPIEFENYSSDMSGSFYGIGVTVTHDKVNGTVTVSEIYQGGGAEEAGLLIGDLIIGAGDAFLSTDGYDSVVENLRSPDTDEVTVTVVRDGAELILTIKKSLVVEKNVEYSMLADNIAYIKISSFKDNTLSQFKEAVDSAVQAGAVGIIYDLRANPGGYLSSVVGVLSYLAPDGTTIATFSDGYAKPKKDNDPHSLSLPSVVICNGKTASAGELFTAAMRDFDDTLGYFDVTVVGTNTYGKGVMQNSYALSDGSRITLTVAYYNPPSGINYDGVGIKPDVTAESESLQLEVAFSEILKLVK